MKRNKRYIVSFLFFISMIMLVIPVIPHHHHTNGNICMKQDIPTENSCSCSTHRHHTDNEPCCDSDCLTRLDTSTPSVQVDNSPHFVLIAILFNDVIIKDLFKPQERRINNDYIYRESLHGMYLSRAFGLRAPPYTYPA